MSTIGLLGRRHFGPLFVTQFGGAFNDNLFRSAMLFLIAFRLTRGDPHAGTLAASLTGGIFILPYVLFSSLSGELADRIDKATVARGVKLAEIIIMAVGAAGLLRPSVPLLYVALFGMGVHSTVFGPVKYAMLPQHLPPDELVGGTALIEAGTFLAILAGQIAGGLLPTPCAAVAVIATALIGIAASRFIPPAPPEGVRPAMDWNVARGTTRMVAHALANPALRHAIIGISWFFALGSVLTQQFVPLVAGLNATPAAAALLLTLFSVGVAIGSLLAGRLMRGRVTARPVPAAAALVVLLMAGIAAATAALHPAATTVGVAGFLALPGALGLAAGLAGLAIAGGVYVVPLYALLQTAGEAEARARAVAANNVVNAMVSVLLTGLSIAVLASGAGLAGLFAALALVAVAALASVLQLRRTAG